MPAYRPVLYRSLSSRGLVRRFGDLRSEPNRHHRCLLPGCYMRTESARSAWRIVHGPMNFEDFRPVGWNSASSIQPSQRKYIAFVITRVNINHATRKSHHFLISLSILNISLRQETKSWETPGSLLGIAILKLLTLTKSKNFFQ